MTATTFTRWSAMLRVRGLGWGVKAMDLCSRVLYEVCGEEFWAEGQDHPAAGGLGLPLSKCYPWLFTLSIKFELGSDEWGRPFGPRPRFS